MHLALNQTTNDLYKPSGGGVSRVDKGRFVIQQVRSKLKTLLGEWILDSSVGWVNFTDFEKNQNIANIEDRARIIIINTQGVRSITSLSSVYKDRVLNVSFTAETIYGTISVDVPWNSTEGI